MSVNFHFQRRFGSVDFVLSKLKKVIRRPSSGGENGDFGPRTVKVSYCVK